MTRGYFFEELRIGQAATLSKTITEEDILMYSLVSLDTNPIHMDEAAARQSRFGGRVAHGMLSAGLISALLGTRLPGPGSIYLRQSLDFPRAGENRAHGKGHRRDYRFEPASEKRHPTHQVHGQRRMW